MKRKNRLVVEVVENNFTWANNYNLLFIDQPVGTGLSYADPSYSQPFAKSMDGIFLIYDVCDENTFLNISVWIDELKNHYDCLPPIIIIGNKCDGEIKVENEHIQKFCWFCS